jgi:putative metallopeptidase
MTDPVRTPGMFDVILEPAFVRSREVADLAEDVIASFSEFEPIATAIREDGLVIGYVWETKPFDPAKDEYAPHVVAKVTKASPLWQALSDMHLVIQFRRWFWERFDDTQRRAVLHHELTHIDVDEADDHGRLPIKLRKHDIEDFNRTMQRFGPVIPGRRAFIAAYADWQRRNPEALSDGKSDEIVVDQAVQAAAVRGAQKLQKLATDSGTDITITTRGPSLPERTVTLSGRKVDPETGEIVG